ncbi:MAG TPA: RidA family protein [Anaerolineae bacterium]|nr:RidA family protein [Anaerolineae bacterium]
MIVSNARGNYQFMRGGAAFSSAVVADEGYAIVHATLLNPLPVPTGFDFIAEHLKREGRPVHAVCGIELRSPRPLTLEGFREFNTEVYRAALMKHDLLVDDVSPMTRSNLAVEMNPPAQPVLFAFSYTTPMATRDASHNFVLAGAADETGDPANPHRVIREGETSDDAMREKAAFVMNELSKRLSEFNLTLDDSTALGVYTVHNIFSYLPDVLLKSLGRAHLLGVHWYFTRPPIQGLEFEADARRALREIFVP